MKITKRQLRRIIREEKVRLAEAMPTGIHGTNLADDSAYESDYAAAYDDLYTALESALAQARKNGLELEDVQTIVNDAINDAGY